MNTGAVLLRAAIATVLAAATISASAQESGASVEEVLVTGSRIKRQDLESVGPVTS